ncbi:MAG: DUF1353 domain-containing protein [Pseudomonadota bacterium]
MRSQFSLRRHIVFPALAASIFLIATTLGKRSSIAQNQDFGRFEGELAIVQIENRSEWKLLRDLTFIGPNGVVWTAPRGTIVNGASIPRAIWPIGAYPWDGVLGKPSVIHDHFWVTKSRHSKDVHRAFYDGLLANKASKFRAILAYAGVLLFGGRWTATREAFVACTETVARKRQVTVEEIAQMCANPRPGKAQIVWTPKPHDRDWKKLKRAVEAGRQPKELERLADQLLLQSDPRADLAKEFGLVSE